MKKRNAIVGQSGGPTAVINSSLYGVIIEAKRYEEIGTVFGMIHGIEGVLKDELIDLFEETGEILNWLTYTPGAALGGCRYMLKSTDPDDEDIKRIFDVFERYDIGYFFYIGGNDSMDTANKIYETARKIGYELSVIGIPKTIDNDLPETHHCPGFGSAAKYVATSVKEAGLHTESMYTSEPISILTTVGRNTGWLPASSILAKGSKRDAPHLVYLPEMPFSKEQFLKDVEKIHKEVGGVFIVTGEGLIDEKGKYVGVSESKVALDAFGHPELGSVGEYLKIMIEKELKLHTRTIKLDICQQSAMHFASIRDRDDAILVGKTAVKIAIDGNSGVMITLEEEKGKTGATSLSNVANIERKMPRDLLNKESNLPSEKYIDYVKPLIEGEVKIPIANGLPEYRRLKGR